MPRARQALPDNGGRVRQDEFDREDDLSANESAPETKLLDEVVPTNTDACMHHTTRPTMALPTVIVFNEKMPTLKSLGSVFDLMDFDRAVDDYEASTGQTIDRKSKVMKRVRRTICAFSEGLIVFSSRLPENAVQGAQLWADADWDVIRSSIMAAYAPETQEDAVQLIADHEMKDGYDLLVAKAARWCYRARDIMDIIDASRGDVDFTKEAILNRMLSKIKPTVLFERLKDVEYRTFDEFEVAVMRHAMKVEKLHRRKGLTRREDEFKISKSRSDDRHKSKDRKDDRRGDRRDDRQNIGHKFRNGYLVLRFLNETRLLQNALLITRRCCNSVVDEIVMDSIAPGNSADQNRFLY